MPDPKTLPDKILTPEVQQFASKWLGRRITASQLTREDLRNFRAMLRTDPVTGMCIELIQLYIISVMGEYSHPDATIEAEVRKDILNCKGKWSKTLRGMMSYLWYGRSWSELAYPLVEGTGRKTLGEIKTLDPTLYTFDGTNGQIKEVIYKSIDGEITLNYADGIHLTNRDEWTFDKCGGAALAEAAYPFWELHCILMPVLAIAGQRQATPLLVQKTETGADIQVLNEDGTPAIDPSSGLPYVIKKGWDALQKLEQMGSAGVAVVDPDDEIYSVELKSDGGFLLNLVKLCEMYRMMAFLVPSTLASYSMSGLGDAGLADSHHKLFEQIACSWAEELAESIVTDALKPLMQFNYGEMEDYGYFPVVNKDNAASLAIAEVITGAIQRGAFTTEDTKVIQKLRDLLDIEPEEGEDLN